MMHVLGGDNTDSDDESVWEEKGNYNTCDDKFFKEDNSDSSDEDMWGELKNKNKNYKNEIDIYGSYVIIEDVVEELDDHFTEVIEEGQEEEATDNEQGGNI
jgi:hypothetical protein